MARVLDAHNYLEKYFFIFRRADKIFIHKFILKKSILIIRKKNNNNN